MIYMFLSNNPSSGDINSSNLSCFFLYFYVSTIRHTIRVSNSLDPDAAKPGVLQGLVVFQTVIKGYQKMTIVCNELTCPCNFKR